MDNRRLNLIFGIIILTLVGFISPASSAIADHGTVFEMPDLDQGRTYTYNTTLDVFVPGRDGNEAILHWGEKASIDGIEYYVFNLSKKGGGELQYMGMDYQNKNITLKKIKDYFTPVTFMDLTFDPATLIINYPLWVGKTWERRQANFSGSVWMGRPVNINGTTWGSAKVIGEEDIIVPAGIAHALVLETTMNSRSIVNGREIWMNNSQKLWLMENGFFAKRQLYHSGRLDEEIELKSPIIGQVDIKPEILNTGSKGEITVLIELPEPHDIAEIEINSIEFNGARVIKSNLENGKLMVKFNRDDLSKEKMTGDKALLTLNGKLNDGTLFEGFDTVKLQEMESGSLIDKVSEIDAFHPPASGDPGISMYKEWQYFNIIDDEQNISFITTLTLNGNISDPENSVAIVLMSYLTPVKKDLTVNVYPVTVAEWSDRTPDLRIAGSNVRLTEEGYRLHVESADGGTVFDAIFKPETEHPSVFSVPMGGGRIMNWLSASPKMKANGTFTVNKGTAEEKTYTFRNVRGYHDHNWGYWLWKDDMGWDWGQATQVKGGDETGTYTFSFGNITNKNHTATFSTVLEFWKNKKIIAGFNDNEMQIRQEIMSTLPTMPDTPFPLVTVMNANSGENRLNIVFTTERITPIPIALESGGYRIIWELIGVYKVSGTVDGKPVSYITTGYLEYVA